MTTLPSEPASADSAPFAALKRAQYISLTTYRRTGAPLPTPVWFAERAGRLYVHTLGGKVKRIRHTPRVTVAACTVGGKLSVPPIAAIVRILTGPAEIAQAEAALAAKYRLVRRLYYGLGGMDAFSRFFRRAPSPVENVYLVIEPTS